jgi:Family of unknown function (DUF5681)
MSGDYEVGYGKPPKAGQFAKGRSGNPGGRPKKKQAVNDATLHPGHLPTQAAIAMEGRRLIAVKSADGVEELPATQVVMRSLFNQAAKGGVLAARTLIGLQQAEDERQYRARRKLYDYWQDYCANARQLLDAATAAGEPEPDLYPHPDDMEFDFSNLEVRICGPIDAEGALGYERSKRFCEFAFEMSVYVGEDNFFDESDKASARLGAWFWLHVIARRQLPPRLQALSVETSNRQLMRVAGPRWRWKEHLIEECAALGIPPIMLKLSPRMLSWADWTKMLRKVRRKVRHQ